ADRLSWPIARGRMPGEKETGRCPFEDAPEQTLERCIVGGTNVVRASTGMAFAFRCTFATSQEGERWQPERSSGSTTIRATASFRRRTEARTSLFTTAR